jgi:hypothetical protein
MDDRYFCVKVDMWPDYFERFIDHCNDIAKENNWNVYTVINYQLKPHGRLIKTSTQGMYLRWNDATHHTAFVLRWS